MGARAQGENPEALLPRRRGYPSSTRLGQWVSPRLAEYVKVVVKMSYNRGAQLLACLVGVRPQGSDCDDGIARVNTVVLRLGVPAGQFFNFDGAGSDDRNHHSLNALNALNRLSAARPWGGTYLTALPVLGEVGGGDLATFGTSSPARGLLRAKPGTRAGFPPGTPAGLLGTLGLSGFLTAASGRKMLVTVVMNNSTLEGVEDIVAVIEDQVAIVEAIHRGG